MNARRGLWGSLGLALAGWLAALHGVDRDAPLSAAQPCHEAAIVDGSLVCGEAVAHAVQRTCPGLAVPPGSVVDRRCAPRFDGELMARLEVPVEINAADATALQSLHGIGPALAARIAAGRPFADGPALLRVRGIGPKTLARIAGRLRFSAAHGPEPDAPARKRAESATH